MLTKATASDCNWYNRLNNITYQYNITIHRALNKSPINVHRNIEEYNIKEGYSSTSEKDIKTNDNDVEMSIMDEKYRQNYNIGIIRSLDFNYKKYEINNEDLVLLKKDFDTK
ncbi:hypothetical protein SLOPH_633 [Spraguea lophii 42_110]|uniref:Uncharacterized protein n=1 Tax=Spraguea lophii (strain 42_110) TaxID=1358809 RepID=S7W523_SPRLO|nr:hypothetical protein SLOPH_633 [Spraguea lophii 42_110]